MSERRSDGPASRGVRYSDPAAGRFVIDGPGVGDRITQEISVEVRAEDVTVVDVR